MKTFFKSTLTIVIVLILGSCGEKKPKVDFEKSTEEIESNSLVDEGKTIFEGKGTCIACHKPNTKIIGPSLTEISKIYKEKNASVVSFLKEESEAIIDPTQYEIMKANLAITKTMSEEELKALEAYIMQY